MVVGHASSLCASSLLWGCMVASTLLLGAAAFSDQIDLNKINIPALEAQAAALRQRSKVGGVWTRVCMQICLYAFYLWFGMHTYRRHTDMCLQT